MAVIKIVPMPGAVGDKGDEGAPGPQGQQGPAGQNGLPGTPALWSYQGTWNSASAYAVGDVVVYQGQLYYTKSVTTAGTLPTDTAKFDLIASKGDQGIPGVNGTNGAQGLPGAAGTNGANGINGTNGTNGTNGADGADGADGAPGTNGADALWNYTGEYSGGAAYAVGDLVTYDGQLWYRYNANGGNVGDTPSPGLWNLLAAKGADGSGGTADTGDITFDGIQIIGAGTASGDGSNLGTIELVPDGDITSDQYVIIDPTSPNHIHLRAGGVQDNSNAHIFLGGERNNIQVSDPYRTVKISTKPDGIENTYGNSNGTSNTEFVHASTADILPGDTVRLYTGGPTYVVDNVTQEYPYAGAITVTAPGLSFITGEAYVFTRDQGYNNEWTFGNDGVLSGPAMGGIWVESIQKKSTEYGLGIYSPVDIVLEASNGEFLNDSSIPDNQIATIGDLPTGWTGTIEANTPTLISVVNGIITAVNSLT